MQLPELLLRFRKSVWFRVFYVTILLLLLSSLLLLPLAWILGPVSLLVIPYWLRERGYRKYIVNGLVALLGSVLFLAAYSAATITTRADSPLLDGAAGGIALTNGTVAPFRGAAGDSFTFTVDLTDVRSAAIRTASPLAPANASVWLNLSFFDASFRPVLGSGLRMDPTNSSDTDLANGKRYAVQSSVLDHVYFFAFSAIVNLPTGRAFAETFSDTGPIVAAYGSYFAVLGLLAGQFAILPGIVYFLLLAGHRLYRRSQRRMAIPRKPREEAKASDSEGGYTCTNCGADVPESAARCPSCGAVFDEGPEVPSAERAPGTEGRDEGR